MASDGSASEFDTQNSLPSKLSLLWGDFRDLNVCNWVCGDVVFCNCSTFTDELWEEVGVQATEMKPGAFFVSTTRELTCIEFKMLEILTFDRDNRPGKITVFIHQRKTHEFVEKEMEAAGSGSDDDDNGDDDETDDDNNTDAVNDEDADADADADAEDGVDRQ